jgi:CBS domain containing-hemolysin-like protein
MEAAQVEGLLAALLCAAIGSIFAAADAALGELTTGHIAALLDQTEGAAHSAIERYHKDPAGRRSRWLVGRVVFTALAAVLVASALAAHVPRWAVEPVGALGALLTYGTIAEVATTVARTRAEAFARRFLPFVRPFELIITPLAAPLGLLGRTVVRLLPAPPPDAKVVETEVEWAVSEGQKTGSIAQEPAEMIRNVLEMKDLVARDVLVPRTQVCAIEVETPLQEVLRVVSTEGHSRFPVYREKIDNIVGLLYAKDLFRVLGEGKVATTRLRDLVRGPVNFVPELQGVSSVLREMRAQRLHMAIVIDEFGGVSGIVTLEDILEVIVGDIRDEYDTEEAPIQDLGNGHLLADASVSVHDLSAYLGAEIPDGDYESLGGLLTHQAGRVPPVGSSIDAYGLSFLVREADEKRIVKVEIIRSAVPAEGEEAEATALEESPSRPSGAERLAQSVGSTPAPAAGDTRAPAELENEDHKAADLAG